MSIKKFIPCIYLYNGHAVRNFTDLSVVETDPLRLVNSFICNHADGIIVFCISDHETDFESPIEILRDIVKMSGIPVFVYSDISTFEEIGDFLNTGCDKFIIDMTGNIDILLIDKAFDIYGKDRLAAMINDPESVPLGLKLIEKSFSSLILMNVHKIRETIEATKMEFIVSINDIALGKLLQIFAYPSVEGVTGNSINDNVKEITDLRKLCLENNIQVTCLNAKLKWEDLKLNNDGMVPVIVQDYLNDEVLMLAYMNKDAYENTILTGKMTYYSRSRNELWLKGATSGHFQYVKSLTADCDKDTILAKVSQIGAACHTGSRSCFFNSIT